MKLIDYQRPSDLVLLFDFDAAWTLGVDLRVHSLSEYCDLLTSWKTNTKLSGSLYGFEAFRLEGFIIYVGRIQVCKARQRTHNNSASLKVRLTTQSPVTFVQAPVMFVSMASSIEEALGAPSEKTYRCLRAC